MELPPIEHIATWIRDHYDVAQPVGIDRFESGTNNATYRLTVGSSSYVLKLYQNADVHNRILFELALLDSLSAMNLPFAVPSPLPDVSGDTLPELSTNGLISHAALFKHIPGRSAEYGNLSDAFRCGDALAVLDRALSEVTLDHDFGVIESYGDLRSTHPYVPDPMQAIDELPEPPSLRQQLLNIMSATEDRWVEVTSGWKRQIIHGDFYPSNALVYAERVTGIIDFETAGWGYRAIDFAIGLGAFNSKSWDEGRSRPILEAFASGYLSTQPLTEDELSATTVMLLMRELGSLVHWIGRRVQGLTTDEDIYTRALRLVALHRWTDQYGDELTDCLLEIQRRSHPE